MSNTGINGNIVHNGLLTNCPRIYPDAKWDGMNKDYFILQVYWLIEYAQLSKYHLSIEINKSHDLRYGFCDHSLS